MLNINKIESDFNKQNLTDSDIAKILGKAYTTINNKRKRESNRWTPDEVEKIADFFKRPISYYFDKEESNLANESSAEYRRCLECERKQMKIDKIRDERDDIYRRYVECLEELCGKKGNSV